MIAATLFSGIGAPEAAMPGWHWPWHAEIEKFPSAVMAARHPQSVNLGNVTAHDFFERAAAIARPDVLVFGSPCQSFSVAGKRLGMDDPRGNLALVALGIVDRLKPRWFVFENVAGLLSSAEGRDFGLFLRTVDEIGYSLAWTVLDAQHFGVAQRRERVFAVGYLGDWRYPAAVLFEPESLCGHHPPRREAGKGTAASLAPSLTASGCGVERSGESRGQDPVIAIERDVSHCLNAGGMGRQDYETETLIAHNRVVGTLSESSGHARPGDNIQSVDYLIPVDTTQITSKGNYSAPKDGDPCHPLAATAHVPAVVFNITPSNSNKDFNAREATYAQALTAGGNRPSARGGDLIAFSSKDHGADAGGQVAVAFNARQDPDSWTERTGPLDTDGGTQAVAHGSAVRRLTPKECERLQGFPDDYTLIEHRGKLAADGPRYKALGNSMAVPVVRWILSRIETVDAIAPLAEAAE